MARMTGEVVAANAAAARMLAYDSADEVCGLMPPTCTSILSCCGPRSKTLVHPLTPRSWRWHSRRKTGSVLKTDALARVVLDASGTQPLLRWLLTDITEMRRLEEHSEKLEQGLRLSQKPQAIGHLSAGVAHDINTSLQYISDSIYLLKQRFDELLKMACLETVAGDTALPRANGDAGPLGSRILRLAMNFDAL